MTSARMQRPYQRGLPASSSRGKAPLPGAMTVLIGEGNGGSASRGLVHGGYEMRSRRWPAEPSSVRRARMLARAALEDWGLPVLSDDVQLCTTELVTNAIRHSAPHTPGSFSVRVSLYVDRFVTVEVDDGDARGSVTPQRRREAMPDTESLSGRGLWLVTRVADGLDWWSYPVGGKTVRCWWDLELRGSAGSGD